MPIQLIIFLTKAKIFACEINISGKAETISIKGNTEIKCEGKESIDELIVCLYDAFNIDDFTDDKFDIIILEMEADRALIRYLENKCVGAIILNIFSMRKVLPILDFDKTPLKEGKEIIVEFADMFYKIFCDNEDIIKVEIGEKSKQAIRLEQNLFACFFNFNINALIRENYEKELNEARNKIEEYKQQIDELKKVQELYNKNLKEEKEKTTIADKTEERHKQLTAQFAAHSLSYDKHNLQGKEAYDIGRKYELGIGVNVDLKRALFLYKQAASYGNQHADAAVKRLAYLDY